MAPVRKKQNWLNPMWFKRTAAIAAKRGTAIVVAVDGSVYGMTPKSGGSVAIHYQTDESWVAEVLARFPKGAVFPDACAFGGSTAAKALKPYANIQLPDDGSGAARIDMITGALHVKGKGTTIHSSCWGANDCPAPKVSDDIPEVSFRESVRETVGKLLVECAKRDDSRPGLKRIYRVDIGGVPHLASTDGRSAIIHRCECAPEGFSFDPSLVGLYDIVGYRRAVIEETGSSVNYYRLEDGTVVVETVPPTEIPKIKEVFEHYNAFSRDTLMETAALTKLVDDVTGLGLGANDSFGGQIVFRSTGVEMLVMGQSVAEFEATPMIDDGADIRFALPVLTRFAKLGGDLCVTRCDKVAGMMTDGPTSYMAMPLAIAKEPGAQ